MCPGRGAASFMPLRRAGTVPNSSPSEPHSAVFLRSRVLARRLEGWPRALVAHPSRLAVKNGEHLRMTAVFDGAGGLCRKLTDDDLNVIEGRREQLEGKLQQRYGFAKDQIHEDVDDWFGTLK